MLEMLVMGGRSLPHAIMMLIPEAWVGNHKMSEEKKSPLMAYNLRKWAQALSLAAFLMLMAFALPVRVSCPSRSWALPW